MAKAPPRSCREAAMNLLARREHSFLELSHKLQQREYSAEDIHGSLERLQDDGLLSNERFTEAYINMRRKRGFGPLRISNELRERGISDELIGQYLHHNADDWWPDLQYQFDKKYAHKGSGDYAERVKRAKFLQGRGFPLDWIMKLKDMSF